MSYKAVIAGASGLIGSNLLTILLTAPEYDEVLVLVRKGLPLEHKKLVQLVIDFDRLEDHASAINGHAIFCCLGTTQKKTPDPTVYFRIDHDYPLKLAELAKQNGIQQYHLVSSIGANAKASNFYLKTKGQTEQDIQKVQLKYLNIYEPSFLTGNRAEFRWVDLLLTSLMKVINPLLFGSLRKYRSIPGKTVAKAMFNQSIKNEEGIFVHPSDKIKLLA